MPRKIAVLDTETDPFKRGRYPIPFAVGVFDGDEYHEWWGESCIEDALVFLSDKEWIVYAHNGGKFDYHFMLDYLMENEHVTIINGRLSKFSIGDCEFRDSINILPVPLSQMQKDEIDYALFEKEVRELPENKRAIRDYLRTDCEYLFDFVNSFIDTYGIHLTQASAALKYWQKLYKRKPPKTDREYYEKFSPYYFGGRVECFQKGHILGKFLSADINSAYPYAMLHEHPISTSYFSFHATCAELIKKIDHWVTGFFSITAESRGALPYRAQDGSLTFPNDNEIRLFHVTGHEIKTGLETGTLRLDSVLQGHMHDGTTNFDEYIYYFYNLRLEAIRTGNKKLDLFCKIFMNSLYGKFGANPENYNEFMVADKIEEMRRLEKYDYDFAGTLGPNFLMRRDLDEEKMRYYNVATAASITGFVRAYLWRHICDSTGVIYCDTDCIVARDVSCDIGENLGQWGIEGHYSTGAVGGKKLYAFKYSDDKRNKRSDVGKYKIASKGTRLKAEEILEVCSGNEVIYRPDAPSYSVFNLPSFNSRKVVMT